MNKRQKQKQNKKNVMLALVVKGLLQDDELMKPYENVRVCYHKKTKTFIALKIKNIDDYKIITNKGIKKLQKDILKNNKIKY